ncbi:MAG: hypothetical protein ACLUW6_02220 [Coriobacteriaceae bacterium]
MAPNDTVSLMEEALVVFSAADDAADRTVTAPTSADGGGGVRLRLGRFRRRQRCRRQQR